ncbi:DUF3150 domain-containing protein [Herbaspirillum huttiense]|uniref:DUF3150 domain-containing protein n=1 Tax=Herbaspirillum huttiense TaxID=863372 RepID=UPI0039B03035
MPSNTGVTQAKDDMQILKDVVLMDFIIGGSTGEKSVGGDDFIREMGKMLPPNATSWVAKYRSEAKREIMKTGTARRIETRTRGYFVPLAHARAVADALSDIKKRFLAEKADFLNNLETIIDAWAEHEDNQVKVKDDKTRGEMIRENAPSRLELDKALTFNISAITLGTTDIFGADDALQAEVKGLVGNAAMEIAEDVTRSWKSSSATKASQKVFGLIRRIHVKASAMTVLSPKFDRLAEICKEVLANIPPGSNLSGMNYLVISSLLRQCSDARTILSDPFLQGNPMSVATIDEQESAEAKALSDVPRQPAGDSNQGSLVLETGATGLPVEDAVLIPVAAWGDGDLFI